MIQDDIEKSNRDRKYEDKDEKKVEIIESDKKVGVKLSKLSKQ